MSGASQGQAGRCSLCPGHADRPASRVEASVEAVLFDVDDTLFDRTQAQREMPALMRRTFPDLFTGIPQGAVRDAFLVSDRISTDQFEWTARTDAARLGRSRIFLQQLGLGEDMAPALTELYVTYYPRIEAPVRDARQVIERLSARYVLGIVSNGMPDTQYQKLETLGIGHWFGCVLLSGEIGIEKPDPQIFWRAADCLGVVPQACMHVGDTYEADVVGAQRAGMRACWYNPQARARPEGYPRPALELHALAELLVSLS
jgi:HAD superfamily hydrolase (TIGR01549 family)